MANIVISRAVCLSGFSRQRGIVLVVVLWVVTLLSIMAASFAYSMRTGTTLATHSVGRAQARALAEAGVTYAMMHMLSPKAAEDWPADGSLREWQFGAGRMVISVVDAGGKIDLNRASRELLGGLLSNVGGVPDDSLDGLLDAIEDWRDPDDIPLLNGAETEAYHASGRKIGPKNAPFEIIGELQSVLGITPDLYQRIADELTVYSNSPGINPALASAATLLAVPGIDALSIEDYIELRAEHQSQGLPPPPPPVIGAYLSQGRGLAYHIIVDVQVESGASAFVEAVVTRERRQNQLYHVRVWRESR